jgi:uncharacterized delta-60 repeat protein
MSARTKIRSAQAKLDAALYSISESLERRILFAAGDLDGTWGSGGTVVTTIPGFGGVGATAMDLVVQPNDGKIVVGGQDIGQTALIAARYDPSAGALDTTFGSSGIATNFAGAGGLGIAEQPDGRFVLTGLGPNAINTPRGTAFLKHDGTLDNGLDNDGISQKIGAHDIKIVDNDRWLLASATGLEFFDVNGVVANYPAGNGATSLANALDVRKDPFTNETQIIAVGYSRTRSGDGTINDPFRFTSNLAIAKYILTVENHKAKITLDTNFGVNGRLTTNLAGSGNGRSDFNSENLHAVTWLPDGSFVVVGNYGDVVSGEHGFVMSKYSNTGALDTTFGTQGRVTTKFDATKTTSQFLAGTGVAIQPANGKILVCGNGVDGNGDPIGMIARFNDDGTADTTFSTDGYADLPDLTTATAVAVGLDGKALITGTSAGVGDPQFAISRVLTNTPLPPGSGSAEVINGILQVAGTNKGDNISLEMLNANTIRVRVNMPFDDSEGGTITDIPTASFTSIQVNGRAGDDEITIGPGVSAVYVNAGADNDRIFGGDNADTLTGSTGNDSINGGDGNDLLNGYSGDDTLNGGGGDDKLNGFDGRDTLRGNAGNDTLDGGANVDFLTGGSGDDSLLGGGGTDRLNGDVGNDFMSGGAGDDIFFAIDSAADTLNGDAGDNDSAIDGFDVGLDVLTSIELT